MSSPNVSGPVSPFGLYFNGAGTAGPFSSGDPTAEGEELVVLNSLRAGKYIFRVAYILVWLFILAIIAAPILGAATPQFTPSNELGLGVNLQTVQPQLQEIFSSSSTIPGSHTVTVPAFNRWFLPASVGLTLNLAENGTTVYQTSEASVSLAPFQSGVLNLTVDIPQSVIAQMQGQQLSGGGQMTLQEDGLWTISVSLGGVQ